MCRSSLGFYGGEGLQESQRYPVVPELDVCVDRVEGANFQVELEKGSEVLSQSVREFVNRVGFVVVRQRHRGIVPKS